MCSRGLSDDSFEEADGSQTRLQWRNTMQDRRETVAAWCRMVSRRVRRRRTLRVRMERFQAHVMCPMGEGKFVFDADRLPTPFRVKILHFTFVSCRIKHTVLPVTHFLFGNTILAGVLTHPGHPGRGAGRCLHIVRNPVRHHCGMTRACKWAWSKDMIYCADFQIFCCKNEGKKKHRTGNVYQSCV